MDLFCSDLDNTLIYSWRRSLRGEKYCVEWLDGREISFMTKRTLELLKELEKKMLFIPVTTRRMEQYQRICFPQIHPSFALTCNGGVLLEEGRMDREWYIKSLEMVEDCRLELEAGRRILEEDEYREFAVWMIQDLFLFTKSGEAEKTKKKLEESLDLQKMDVLINQSKVYAIPKVLNKGTALERLKKRLGAERVFAAGDSVFDVPMLEKADYAYRGGEEPFAEEMLAYFLEKSRSDGLP